MVGGLFSCKCGVGVWYGFGGARKGRRKGKGKGEFVVNGGLLSVVELLSEFTRGDLRLLSHCCLTCSAAMF
jgi:hypothetical protein